MWWKRNQSVSFAFWLFIKWRMYLRATWNSSEGGSPADKHIHLAICNSKAVFHLSMTIKMEHLSKPINPAKKVKKHIYLSSIYIQHHKLFLIHVVFQTFYWVAQNQAHN
jgi:hypothetical protein